nr:G protein-coupled receptor [Proales similis]
MAENVTWTGDELNYATQQIVFFSSVTVVPIGLLLCAFAFYVFSRERLAKASVAFLYKWQLGVDMLLLIFNTYLLDRDNVLQIRLDILSDLSCRLVSLTRNLTLHASSWMTLFITLDRFMAVRHPTRLTRWRQDKLRLSLLILAMFALIFVIDLEQLFFNLEQSESARGNQTIVSKACVASPLVMAVSDIISILLRTYIPFGLMMALDVAIVRRLINSRNKFDKQKPPESARALRQRREKRFTFAVLCHNGLFFAFNLPLSIAYMFSAVNRFSGEEKDASSRVIYEFVYSIASRFALLFQCSSFFINISFNVLFRTEFIAIFSKRGH